MTNTRNKMAATCQGGASNERRVAMALVEAIDECRKENVNPRDDAACFLILHQLVYLMTDRDFALDVDRLRERWNKAMAEVGS